MATLQTKARKARVELSTALTAHAMAYGEAMRINGMRQYKDSDELYQRELERWNIVSLTQASFDRALRAYTRALRQAAK